MENCNGQWLKCARKVLQRNGVEESYFAERVYELLNKGSGKYRNIMIVGVANCGKESYFAELVYELLNKGRGKY